MSGITFGGLATGMDTDALVNKLMELERRPIDRLNTDKQWFQSRQDGYSAFDGKLKGLLSSMDALTSSDDLRQKTVSASDSEHFSVSAGVDALPNTSYQVETISLAQVQKSVSDGGFADKTLDQFGSGSISFTVGGEAKSVTIDAGDGSLEGIMAAINEADIGVFAAIINDGSSDPYRLVLTGADVATDFSVDTSSLSGGSASLGDFSTTQAAAKAHIKVDNIDIYADSNTLKEAIPGLTLNLAKAETGATTSISVKLDEDGIKSRINSFVKSYNDAVSFVTSQSSIDGSKAGILGGDSGLNVVKRRLQNMLTTVVDTGGAFSSLSQLGFETQKDGSIKLDDATLTDAIKNNLDDVDKLLTGTGDTKGIADTFKEYLEDVTDSSNGLAATNSKSTTTKVKRIDSRIEQIEMRLEAKEKTLRAKFMAMEKLVSGMNSQSDFLTTQLKGLENLWNYKK